MKNNKIYVFLLSALTIVIMTVSGMLSCNFSSYAAEDQAASGENVPVQNYEGTLMNLMEPAKAYASKDTDSEVVREFNTGDLVLVVEEDDNWYAVYYDSRLIYIPKAAEGDTAVMGASNMETLTNEFDKQAQIDKAWIESFNSQVKAMRNARIWRVAIVVIIVLLVAFIVYKGVTAKNTDENE